MLADSVESVCLAEFESLSPAQVWGLHDIWINEFDYDNKGADGGEFIEIAGPAGTNPTGWTIVGYNGNGGQS